MFGALALPSNAPAAQKALPNQGYPEGKYNFVNHLQLSALIKVLSVQRKIYCGDTTEVSVEALCVSHIGASFKAAIYFYKESENEIVKLIEDFKPDSFLVAKGAYYQPDVFCPHTMLFDVIYEPASKVFTTAEIEAAFCTVEDDTDTPF